MAAIFCMYCELEIPPGEPICVMCGKPAPPPPTAKSAHKRPAKKRPAKKRPAKRPGAKPGAKRRPPLELYVAIDEEQQGPFDFPALRRLHQEGKLSKESLVWEEGMDEWIPAGTLKKIGPLFLPAKKGPPPLPGKTGAKPPPALPEIDDAMATQAMSLGALFDDDTVKFSGRKPKTPVRPPTSNRPPPKKLDPADVRAWFVCDPFRPVPMLKSKSTATLGRRRGCDLVLPHESVSKVHATIRALGDQMTVEDQSSYGTYLNGKRITTSPLSHGDVIMIGPYSIEVRQRPERIQAPGEATTRPFRTMSQTKEAMQGRIEKTSLSEVLQQIEFYGKTGTLKIFTDDKRTATLVCYEGAPMYAELDELEDEEAVYAMLTLKKGSFSLVDKVEAGEASMVGVTLTALLMEASRRVDEGE